MLIDKLEAVTRGEITRLMIFMPPGHAKSTYASVLFPPWWLAQDPTQSIIAASNIGKLAERFGRRVRNLIAENAAVLGYSLSEDSQAAGQWSTAVGGEYYAAGVGAAIAGRRAKLALIDDPIASREDAESQDLRETLWEWYRADVRTRLIRGGAIVIINTRWHEDDLCGRILPETYNGETGWITARDGEQWFVLSLPAIAERFDDLLGRNPGESLWPAEYPLERLRQEETTQGARNWAALYQQRPKPLEGALFKPEKITKIGELPVDPVSGKPVRITWARGWDFSAAEQIGLSNPDWCAGVLIGKTDDGRIIIGDVSRQRGHGPDGQEAQVRSVAGKDGRQIEISIPQDPGQAGKVQVLAYVRKLHGHRVHVSTESGSKITRADPFATQVNNGNVYMLIASWNRAYLDELAAFPNGSKDDQVDASSRAYSRLIAPPKRAKRTHRNFMAR